MCNVNDAVIFGCIMILFKIFSGVLRAMCIWTLLRTFRSYSGLSRWRCPQDWMSWGLPDRTSFALTTLWIQVPEVTQMLCSWPGQFSNKLGFSDSTVSNKGYTSAYKPLFFLKTKSWHIFENFFKRKLGITKEVQSNETYFSIKKKKKKKVKPALTRLKMLLYRFFSAKRNLCLSDLKELLEGICHTFHIQISLG